MNPSPFKFLDSYTRADIDGFFGRERETAELFRQCFLSNILVVYGGSGTGKTSLVQCGLSSRFQDSDWLPLPVRRSGDMLQALRDAMRAATITPIDSDDLGELASNLYLDHFKPIWFLFDQFEELFIFGGHAESQVFFSAIRALLEKERNARAIFVVREEYLAELTRYERILPGLIENRYRVERMARGHAVSVVEKLCAAHGISCTQGFAEAMVDRLNPEGQGVELSYLQVYLDRCWRTRKGDEPFSIALLERIGYVDDLLGAFLDEQVADTPEPKRAEALLKTFVSDQGTKRQLNAAEAHDWVRTIGTAMEPADVERLLQLFVAKRLLKDRDERGRYELLHDALARQIFQRITRAEQELIEVRQFVQQAHGQHQKRGVGLTANDLNYLRPYRNQLHLSGDLKDFVEGAFGAEERRARRRRLMRNTAGALLLVLLIATGYYAWQLNQRLRAEERDKQSIALAEDAMKVLKADPWYAYLMAERAFQISPTFESEKALVAIYPFLYPEVARYRGNGFKQMPYSKSILIIDEVQNSVNMHSMDKGLVWADTVRGMKMWSGATVLDTAGVVMLRGDELVVRRTNGELLFRRPVPDTTAMWGDGRRVLFSAGDWMIRVDSIGRVHELQLDTNGVHRCLAGLDELFVDEEMSCAMVMTDSAVHFFDPRSDNFKLLHRWDAPEKLLGRLRTAGKGECIVQTSEAMYHLAWNPIHGFKQLARVDYAQLNLKNSWRSTWSSAEVCVPFRSEPLKLYDVLLRKVLTIPNTLKTDQILDYDPESRTVLCWSQGDKERRGAAIIRRAGEEWWHLIDDDMDLWDVRMTGQSILIKKHSRENNLFAVAGLSLIGDTIWSRIMRTTRNGRQEGGSFSSRFSKKGASYKESVPALFNMVLYHDDDSLGRHLRFGYPSGVMVEHDAGTDDQLWGIYSDSLVVLTAHARSKGMAPRGELQLGCMDGVGAYTIDVRNGRLECFFTSGRSDEESFEVDLDGCLDTIQVRGYVTGEQAKVLSARWAWAYKYDEDRRPGVGYLVELKARVVVDTGSFARPAWIEALPHGGGFVRIEGGTLTVLDSTLRTIRVLSLPITDPKLLKRAGDLLLSSDSLKHGVINGFDLRTSKEIRRMVPIVEEVYSNMRNRVFNNSAIWIDDQDVVYVLPYNDQQEVLILAVGPDGQHTKLESAREQVFCKFKPGQPLQFVLSRKVNRSTTNGWSSGSTGESRRTVRFDSKARAFVPSESIDPQLVFASGAKHVERDGKRLWDLGESIGWVCGNYLYSTFRAVDHYERFPLYGAEVIRLVREEKQFAPFWEHIDPEPRIRAVLERQ